MTPEAKPLISIITPVYNIDGRTLRSAVRSVRRQSYPNWQLCLVDDASTVHETCRALTRLSRVDERIELYVRSENGGIAAASNDGLRMAGGEFVGFLDHDDELAPDALMDVAELVVRCPRADVIYSDEDKIAPDGSLCDPFYKPDWAPEYFRSCNYICHFLVYRRSLVDDVGHFRPGFEGAQDYDLALRVTEKAREIHHIPKVLYHWRMSARSTSSNVKSKPYAVQSGKEALADHLERVGIAGSAEDAGHPTWFRVRYEISGEPLVSIVIPTRGSTRVTRTQEVVLVMNCVESILRTTSYSRFEVLCVLDEDTPRSVVASLRRIGDKRVRVITFPEPFNFARKINLGAVHAKGEHLLLLNDDVRVISPEWLTAMLEFSQQPEIGAVGAKLLFPDGRIQHAGVVLPGGWPGHVFYGLPGDHPGYFGNLVLACNYSAVTAACMMTRREVFVEAGGLANQFPVNFNDTDYCLKVRFLGYRCVFTPHAELVHYESSTRENVVSAQEIERFRGRWAARYKVDPYYNPNLAASRRDFTPTLPTEAFPRPNLSPEEHLRSSPGPRD